MFLFEEALLIDSEGFSPQDWVLHRTVNRVWVNLVMGGCGGDPSRLEFFCFVVFVFVEKRARVSTAAVSRCFPRNNDKSELLEDKSCESLCPTLFPVLSPFVTRF